MRRFFKQFDLLLIFIPLVLSATSVATIFALVQNKAVADPSVWWKQGIFALLGIVISVVLTFIDYRALRTAAMPIYLFFTLLLVLVLGTTKISGSARWFQLGFFQFQPSEFFKVVLILALATLFYKGLATDIKKAILWAVFSMVPILLVLRQPDLGTALVLTSIALAMLFSSRPIFLVKLISASVLALALLVFIFAVLEIKPFHKILQPYQRERVVTFINPRHDPLGSGYNVTQSIIAVGAGGVYGRGLGQGSQTQLRYVPASSTDFIFTAFAESFGFVGTAVFILVYAIFLWRIIAAAAESRDDFGRYLAIGAFFLFITQMFINIGMTIGVMPVTGIPLPYMSYGGSNMITAYILVGIVQSVVVRRKRLEF